VVLLDEVEKAHPAVHEIFFQVFDKGWMEDGEGRVIDFTNTLIFLTTNVGSELILALCKDTAARPDPEQIAQALRKALLRSFPAALLGRMVTIPYYPLSDDMIGKIARLQLGRVAKRVHESHRIPFTYDDDVVKLIAGRCTELESGGRMIDSILTNTLLPRISQELLTRIMQGKSVTRVATTVTGGEFHYAFD
jgi:type VI secretion system protein VasG